MQAGEPGTKGKLSISVANDFGRPPRICRLVTCSSCCSVPTSKALVVDLCSDVSRIMDVERMRLCMHLLVVAKCDVIPRLETFQALNDTGTLFTRNFAGLGQRAGADAGKEWISGFCRPYFSKSQSGIERIRLLEMLNRCSRKHFGALKWVTIFAGGGGAGEGAGRLRRSLASRQNSAGSFFKTDLGG